MNNKKLVISVFILVALVQLYVPANMIFEREEVLESGEEFKFITAPIDPNDPYRGKYIALRFKENTFEVRNPEDWSTGETVYVLFSKDTEGFAKIKSISKNKPADFQDFLKTHVSFVKRNGSNEIIIDYPFDRFYMEETKAHEAENAYTESQRDTSYKTYALVYIKNGIAVLNDVLMYDVSIVEIVRENQENGK